MIGLSQMFNVSIKNYKKIENLLDIRNLRISF